MRRLVEDLALAHGLDFLAQVVELGLAGHLVETGAELRRHAAQLAHELAKLVQHFRQVLGTDDDQRHHGDDDVLKPTDFGKHALVLKRANPRRSKPAWANPGWNR